MLSQACCDLNHASAVHILPSADLAKAYAEPIPYSEIYLLNINSCY